MIKRFFLSEKNMLIAIVLNAIVITMLYFPQWHHNFTLEAIDHVFIVIFLIEAIVKLSVLKPKQYFASSWNLFDFVIVVASLPTLVGYFWPLPNTSVLLILRLLRLIRLLRFIRFIPRMTLILAGLGRALKASLFVMGALMFFNFLLALFSTHFFADVAPEYFGNPLTSSYTIFQLFTIEGWNEIPASIIEGKDAVFSGLTRLYFVIVVLTGGIFGMSLANAIFVDEMTSDNNLDLETKIDILQEEITALKDLLKDKL